MIWPKDPTIARSVMSKNARRNAGIIAVCDSDGVDLELLSMKFPSQNESVKC